ncbi:MAG: alpha/beta hydrolase [Promethearchaeota archaeon]
MKFEDVTASFEMGSGQVYVLLLHGYTGNPYELSLFAEYLINEGFHVVAPLYPGHAKDKFKLARTTKNDWIGAVENALNDIRSKDPTHIFVSGLSMGGLLTLHVGITQPDITAIAPICGPVFLKKRMLVLLPIVKRFMTYFPIIEKVDAQDPAVKADPIFQENMKRYDKTVVSTVIDLLSLMKEAKENLDQIKQPIMIVQAKKDKTVHPSNATYILDHVNTESSKKQILWLENSGHVATLDYDRNLLFSKVSQFFKENL